MNRTLSLPIRTFYILLAACIIIFTALNIPSFSPVISQLSDWDNSIMLALNYDGGPATDRFWFTISKNLAWIPLGATLLLSLAFYRRHWYIPILIIVGLALVVTLADQISSSLIKPHFARLRPSHNPEICDMLHYVNNYKAGKYGFVSSHAANAFGVFIYLAMEFRHKAAKIILLAWSCMVAYSRIYLGVHYPGDIIGGALVGLTVGLGVNILMKYVYLKISKPDSDEQPVSRQQYIVESSPITAIVIATSLYLLVYSYNRLLPFAFYDIMIF